MTGPVVVDLAEEAVGELGGDDSASDIPNGEYDLGNGHKIKFVSEQFRLLMHSEEVVKAVKDRTDGVTDECNATKKKKYAEYETLIQNEAWTTRARGFTRPANVAARYDDAINSTMLKAAANAPNDPKLGGDGPTGSESSGEDGGDEEDVAADGAATDAAGAAADVAADVAEVAIIAL
jgi:hypothetical protein